MYSYRRLCVVYVFLDAATLTEVYPCFFLSCKGITSQDGARPALSQIAVLFYVLFVLCRSVYCFVCKCVLYCCHRVTTQLQLINISTTNPVRAGLEFQV